jgi:hypothetical protein
MDAEAGPVSPAAVRQAVRQDHERSGGGQAGRSLGRAQWMWLLL